MALLPILGDKVLRKDIYANYVKNKMEITVLALIKKRRGNPEEEDRQQ